MRKSDVAVSMSNKTEIKRILGIVGSEPDSEATNNALFPPVHQLTLESPLRKDALFLDLIQNAVKVALKDGAFLSTVDKQSEKKIAVPVKSGVELIAKHDIIYLEASGNYTKVHRKSEKPLLVSKTLKLFEPALKEECFVRIHRKYMVNIHEIEASLKSNGGELKMSNGAFLSINKKQQENIRVLLEQITSFI